MLYEEEDDAVNVSTFGTPVPRVRLSEENAKFI